MMLFLIFFILTAWISIRRIRLCRKMAPGPYSIPVLGPFMATLGTPDIFSLFEKYKEKYGKVFSLSVGDYYVTVVTDYKLSLAALKKSEFEARPDFSVIKIRNWGVKDRGILFSSGGRARKEQRRFVLKSFKNFGVGTDALEGFLIDELNDLRNLLRKDLGLPIDLEGKFHAPVVNSLWVILTGNRFGLEDPAMKHLVHIMLEDSKRIVIFPPSQFLDTMTTLLSYILRLAKFKFLALEKVRTVMETIVDEHLASYQPGQVRDFVDEYIQQAKDSAEESSFHGDEGKENLIVLLHDFLVAGADTSATTILWTILYLSSYPQVQRKLQGEIDTVIGRSRAPNRSDKARTIYMEAVLSEVHRVCSLLPYSVYHMSTKDSEIGGHFVPKRSVIFFSIRDAHYDKEVWGDPHIFRPERFLDESGTGLVKYEALIPFSSGRRQCPGEALARNTLFIILTGLLQSFNFEFDPNSPKPDLRGSPNFVSQPSPFKVVITERA